MDNLVWDGDGAGGSRPPLWSQPLSLRDQSIGGSAHGLVLRSPRVAHEKGAREDMGKDVFILTLHGHALSSNACGNSLNERDVMSGGPV